MKEIALLFGIILVLFYALWKIGQRNARKPLTLDDLDFRIQAALLNELNAKGLKILINEMRTRITEKLNTSLTEFKRLALECDLKRLESLEKMFEFKFVEFLLGAKVVYPNPEKYADLERKYSPDLCCGKYEDPQPGEKETNDINLDYFNSDGR